ncbi:MAG TPA: phosphatase PAP2 family protein [Patescibacteria group bacterium]|jgi:undecaprenyl-diphosphatase|nr:phosphatase PAP2 family protein [Patescibacteria group bacterium]
MPIDKNSLPPYLHWVYNYRAWVGKLAVALLLFWTPVVIFFKTADEILEGKPIGADVAILQFIHSLQNGFLDWFFSTFTNIGGVVGVAVLVVGFMALYLYRREYRHAIIFFSCVSGAILANLVLKLIFQRTRPDLWTHLVTETSFSFPSGHSMASSAIGFALIAIYWNTKYRWFVVAAALLYVLFVGLSRLYLGVHYPTDVVGGWSASAAWTAVVVYVTARYHKKVSDTN